MTQMHNRSATSATGRGHNDRAICADRALLPVPPRMAVAGYLRRRVLVVADLGGLEAKATQRARPSRLGRPGSA